MGSVEKFSKAEERANALSHLAGALLATVGLVLMVQRAALIGGKLHLVSASVFGASMVILYLSSTLTHILPEGRAKDRFFNYDRIAIYMLIAGTYTPLVLITLNGTMGWIIFGIEWGLALVGTIFVLRKPGDYDSGVNYFYLFSYVVMGWVIVIAFGQLMNRLPVMGWVWVLIGGGCYSVGILFFKVIKFPFHHLVWHLLVIAGTASHFIAVFFYVIPG